jgi:hypothetical protein
LGLQRPDLGEYNIINPCDLFVRSLQLKGRQISAPLVFKDL